MAIALILVLLGGKATEAVKGFQRQTALVVELGHAPGVGGSLAGVKLACLLGFERQQVHKVAPAQLS